MEEEVSAAEASWDLVEAEGDQPAGVPLDHPEALHPVSGGDSEVAEEAGISPILNTGRITKWLHSTAAMDPQRIVATRHEIVAVEEVFFGLSI